MPTFTNVKTNDIKEIENHGFSSVPIRSEHEIARFGNGAATLIFFKTKKLLVQGTKEATEKAAELLKKLKIGEEEKNQHFKEETGTVIGSDEVLKGDTFGGMVVAGVKANEDQRKALIALGVADSKTLSDDEIRAIAPEIEKCADFEIKNLYPEEYNEFKGGITQLLNHLHRECYSYLKPGTHIVDKFPGCIVGNIIETKADSNYVEVAAASILARAHALKQLDDLSKRAGFTIPKGSTHVKAALEKLKKLHLHPHNFVKLNFKNVKEALEK